MTVNKQRPALNMIKISALKSQWLLISYDQYSDTVIKNRQWFEGIVYREIIDSPFTLWLMFFYEK